MRTIVSIALSLMIGFALGALFMAWQQDTQASPYDEDQVLVCADNRWIDIADTASGVHIVLSDGRESDLATADTGTGYVSTDGTMSLELATSTAMLWENGAITYNDCAVPLGGGESE